MASDAQAELKEYCQSINAQNELSSENVKWLIRWLKENSQLSTPAVNNLRDIVKRTAADKKITSDEKQEILSSVREVAADWELDLSSDQGFDEEYRLADEGYGLAEEVDLRIASTDGQTSPCPKCGTAIEERAIVCINCGFDLRHGEQRETVRSEFVDAGDWRFEVDRRDSGTLTVTYMRLSLVGFLTVFAIFSVLAGIAKLLSPDSPFSTVLAVFGFVVIVACALLPRFGGTILQRHSFQQKYPTLGKWGPYFFAQDKRSYRIQDFHYYDVDYEREEDEHNHIRERYVLRISGGFFRSLRYEFSDRYEAYSVLNLIRSVDN